MQYEGVTDEPTGAELERLRESTSSRSPTGASGKAGGASPTSGRGQRGSDTATSPRIRPRSSSSSARSSGWGERGAVGPRPADAAICRMPRKPTPMMRGWLEITFVESRAARPGRAGSKKPADGGRDPGRGHCRSGRAPGRGRSVGCRYRRGNRAGIRHAPRLGGGALARAAGGHARARGRHRRGRCRPAAMAAGPRPVHRPASGDRGGVRSRTHRRFRLASAPGGSPVALGVPRAPYRVCRGGHRGRWPRAGASSARRRGLARRTCVTRPFSRSRSRSRRTFSLGSRSVWPLGRSSGSRWGPRSGRRPWIACVGSSSRSGSTSATC